MEIYHQYVRLRKHFGRWPTFMDEGAEMLADIRPNDEHASEYIERSPVTTVAQVVPEMSEHDANTNAVIYVNRAMNHQEGGWPKDVDYTEAEHTNRYKKKVEKDEEYLRTLNTLSLTVEQLSKQNSAIDIYEDYFQDLQDNVAVKDPHAKTITVFRDPNKIKRSCNYLSWHPSDGKLAVAHCNLDFQAQPAGMSLESYIWDLNNPNQPEYTLRPHSQIVSIKFNVKDSNYVGVGKYNGQLALYDVRASPRASKTTPIEKSHLDPVYDFAWLQSKTGMECMSLSTDGSVLWWDMRKLEEGPMESMPLREKGSDFTLGGVALEYDPQAGATKFMIGTEQGSILSCNRKAKNPQDRVAGTFSGHHGPVYGLKRHWINTKYFLSIGDWTARIWAEDSKTPLMLSPYHSTYLTGGCWSPVRPGVFYTIRQDGILDVWDLYFKHNQPTLQVQVTDRALTSLQTKEEGNLCAIGDENGSVSLLQLGGGLTEFTTAEKQMISGMLEREGSREKNLEKAIKEAKVKARKEAAKKDDLPEGMSEEQLMDVQKSFFATTGAEEGPAAEPAVAEAPPPPAEGAAGEAAADA